VDDSTASPIPETSERARRPNYQGGVYARKDGRWDVAYTKRTSRGSKHVRTTVRTEEEAWRLLDEALGLAERGSRGTNPRLRARLHLYFVQGVDGGPIKIGVARNVRKRLTDMQIGCPIPLNAWCELWGHHPNKSAKANRGRPS